MGKLFFYGRHSYYHNGNKNLIEDNVQAQQQQNPQNPKDKKNLIASLKDNFLKTTFPKVEQKH